MTLPTRILDRSLIIAAWIFGGGSILLLMASSDAHFIDFGWSATNSLLWDAGLSLLFFIQHSGMVRRPFRERIPSRIPNRYHGIIYTIGSGVALAIVAIFWQRSGITLLALSGIARFAAIGAAAIAVAVFGLSIYALRSFDPLGVGPIRDHLRAVEHRPGPFVVRGPYRWMRHPLYACIIVVFWASPVLTADRLLFNVLWTAWMIVGTYLEERDLVREFGDAYRHYQTAVPMLIPWRGKRNAGGLPPDPREQP